MTGAPLRKKAEGDLLSPPAAVRASKHGRLVRGVALIFLVILCGVYWHLPGFTTTPAGFDQMRSNSRCLQNEALVPDKNKALWEALGMKLGTDTFKSMAVEWIGGAVKIPTEVYDDLGEIGVDPRWDAFSSFHDYLSRAFPLVHSTLELTKVNTYGLVYTWQGSNASLKPLLLTAHQDVVPVNPATVGEWTYPPYSGYFDGSKIWGRGSYDDKSALIGTLASVEVLISNGFKPTRTLILAYGFDEEVNGRQGAQHIAAALYEKYGDDGIAFLIDEGGGYAETYGTVFATPGIAEKGHLDVRVEVSMLGGHSSLPPAHTSIGMLSALLVHYESNPFEAELTKQNPLYNTLQCLAEYGKDVPDDLRKYIKRSWTSKKSFRRLEEEIFKDPLYRNFAGNTQAIDYIRGGVIANALPETAWAVVDHRISVMSSVDEVKNRDSKLLEDLAKNFNLTYTAFGTELFKEMNSSPSSGKLTLTDAFGTGRGPSPVTPTDAAPYRILSGTIKATYNSYRSLQGANEITVSPGLFSGCTDSGYYWNVTKNIFRYIHTNAGPDGGLSGMHTVDEFIKIDTFVEMIHFFATLILNTDESGI